MTRLDCYTAAFQLQIAHIVGLDSTTSVNVSVSLNKHLGYGIVLAKFGQDEANERALELKSKWELEVFTHLGSCASCREYRIVYIEIDLKAARCEEMPGPAAPSVVGGTTLRLTIVADAELILADQTCHLGSFRVQIAQLLDIHTRAVSETIVRRTEQGLELEVQLSPDDRVHSLRRFIAPLSARPSKWDTNHNTADLCRTVTSVPATTFLPL